MRGVVWQRGRQVAGGVRLDEWKSAGSGIAGRAIRRSDRHRGSLRSNFVATERQEADYRLIMPSIWGMSVKKTLVALAASRATRGRPSIETSCGLRTEQRRGFRHGILPGYGKVS